MDYTAALEFLDTHLFSYQKVGSKAMKPGLDNIRALCEALGNPQNDLQTLHISGTNGKGSVASMVTSILMEAGYSTGLFTSPHLLHPRERIKVNGKDISETAFADFVSEHHALIERVKPSFFELTVAMALSHFAAQQVEFAIIEVGMGGREDATNLIFPKIAAITNVSLDHTDWLGPDLESIAEHKGGIIKPGSELVLGQMDEVPLSLFESIAEGVDVSLNYAPDLFTITPIASTFTHQRVSVHKEGEERYPDLHLDLPGKFQQENLATALTIWNVLVENEWVDLDRTEGDPVIEGLNNCQANSGLTGRLKQLQTEPTLLIDIAHNEAGIAQSLHALQDVSPERLHIVWGRVAGKDGLAMLNHFPRKAQFYFVSLQIPRGIDASILLNEANQTGRVGTAYSTVMEGVNAALRAAQPEDVIWVGGSTFVVSTLLASLPES